MKTSWRRVSKNSLTWWHILKRPWRYFDHSFFKRPGRRLGKMTKTSLFVSIKISWRHFRQDECLLSESLIFWKFSSSHSYYHNFSFPRLFSYNTTITKGDVQWCLLLFSLLRKLFKQHLRILLQWFYLITKKIPWVMFCHQPKISFF